MGDVVNIDDYRRTCKTCDYHDQDLGTCGAPNAWCFDKKGNCIAYRRRIAQGEKKS